METAVCELKMESIKGLLNEVTKELQSRQLKVATAESCTGGLVSSLLTEEPGSSTWFDRGFVVYSNLAKRELLKVPASLIENYGAVSKEVAIAMAEGALQHSNADLTLAVTGIAGPTGGTTKKPVGTVWFAFATHASSPTATHKLFANKERNAVRELACKFALKGLLKILHTV